MPDSAEVRTLDPLDVEVSATISATKLKMQGFEERRLKGRGVFITREQIEQRGAMQLSDLLTNISGVRVRRDDYRQRVGILMGRGAYACEPVLYIDGSPRSALEINDYHPAQVEAMEIYTRVSMSPPGYRSGRCGSVLIWSRETLPAEHAQ
jgi:outer membrane receptor for ferric coprogen and ferric-rhodotorulic acid